MAIGIGACMIAGLTFCRRYSISWRDMDDRGEKKTSSDNASRHWSGGTE